MLTCTKHCGGFCRISLVPSYSALCRPAFIPAVRLSQRFLLGGFGALPGFACIRFAGFKPFWPLALVQQALPAIVLAALRRFRGAALFPGPRPSSRLGAPFRPSGLTVRRSRPPTAAAELRALARSENRFILAHGLFTCIHLLKRLSAGFFAACRASLFWFAPVASIFGL